MVVAEQNRYGGTCDVCLSEEEHRVWCEEGGGTELAQPDNCIVGIDHEHFPAYVDPAEPLWNGAVVPGFSAAVADQVVAWLNECYARHGAGSDRAEWDQDVVVVHSPEHEGEDGYQPERVEASPDGRFYIGARSYTWQRTGPVHDDRPTVHDGRTTVARRRRSMCVRAQGRRGGRRRVGGGG
jgi:hypothetical protein